MKLPSIHSIVETTLAVSKRFPLSVLVGIVGFVLGITLLHADEPGVLPNIIIMLILAFPLFIAITLFSEERRLEKNKQIYLFIGAFVFLAIYYTLLPTNIFFSEEKFFIRYVQWMISFVLLVTFITFLTKRTSAIRAFWNYNKHLIFSAAITVLWAGAIQMGLSIALGSIDVLFDLDIKDDRYIEIWIFLVSIFSPIFFLSRVPKATVYFYKETEYPRELKLFSQYVLVPLVTLYFLILYAYVLRIIITQEWPEGVLAYMILGFSFFGVLTYISLYPLRESHHWIKRIGDIFFIAVIPQIGMLYWALWFRVSLYGITENRYFVGIFGLWLLIIALILLFNKVKDIRIIPITFFMVTLLSSFGPWGAFSIAQNSQTKRLESLLEKNNLLLDGKIQKTENEIPFDDAKEIAAVITYLNRTHGLSSIQPWFTEDLANFTEIDPDKNGRYNYKAPERIVEELIGIEHINEWEGITRDDNSFSINLNFKEIGESLHIAGFERLVNVYSGTNIFTIDGKTYAFELNENKVTLSSDDVKLSEILLGSRVQEVIKKGSNRELSRTELTFSDENETVSLKLILDNVNGDIDNGSITINSFNGTLLFTITKNQ
jgi:hypothetical protein